jgi:predicted ArsR family transcriptional regulator
MQSTRHRILEILKEKNQATVEQLSDLLELTPVTIRHHLDILRGEGLIGAPIAQRRSGPGRPQYAYALTEAASDFFPKNYHNLAGMLLDEIRDSFSPAELDQIVNRVADRMAAQAPSARTKKRGQEILSETVRYLNDKGYVARWEKTQDGKFVLHTCNCPYERVAQDHSEVCIIDAKLIRQLVGLPLQRLTHMAKGDESCSYVVDLEDSSLD